jgi:hypothetical protein
MAHIIDVYDPGWRPPSVERFMELPMAERKETIEKVTVDIQLLQTRVMMWVRALNEELETEQRTNRRETEERGK